VCRAPPAGAPPGRHAVREIIDDWLRWIGEGETPALATVIRVDGSAPRDEGAKMLIAPSGKISGSVSGGCVESAVAEEARGGPSIRDLLARGRSQVVALAEREVFVDAVAARSRLIIVGAVHIAAALCEFAAKAGFAVTVVDPRERLNNRDRFPQATRLAVGW